MTIRIVVCVIALLLAGCSGGSDEAVEAKVVEAPEVDAVDAPPLGFEESWGDLGADQQGVYCRTHVAIGPEEAHELFVGRLADDAEVPSLEAWSALVETECPPPETVADEPRETEVVEEPDLPAEATPEEVPDAGPVSPEVPRIEGEVIPATESAEALLILAEDNVGAIIYLDVRFPADDVNADEGQFVWVPGSYGSEEPHCREFPDSCGAEYLLRDVGTHTDSGLHWTRGQWRLYGYFSVPVIAGPNQGSWSVNLRAIPIESVPR